MHEIDAAKLVSAMESAKIKKKLLTCTTTASLPSISYKFCVATTLVTSINIFTLLWLNAIIRRSTLVNICIMEKLSVQKILRTRQNILPRHMFAPS